MIWRISAKIELALNSVLKVFTRIINESKNNNFINHLFDEVCIGMHLIHRKFKQKAVLNELIEVILDNWPKVLTSEAKCGYVYLYMKFAIKNKAKMSDRAVSLAEDFENEEDEVQLGILGAIMRAYLDFPNRLAETVKRVFTFASENSENPDLRDRAFIYWRLISNKIFIILSFWRLYNIFRFEQICGQESVLN